MAPAAKRKGRMQTKTKAWKPQWAGKGPSPGKAGKEDRGWKWPDGSEHRLQKRTSFRRGLQVKAGSEQDLGLRSSVYRAKQISLPVPPVCGGFRGWGYLGVSREHRGA